MFVCLCNALRESDIQAEAAAGTSSLKEVFSRLGCNPVCGKCVPHMRDCLKSCAPQESISDGSDAK